jgi:hypothetical protein
MMLGFRESFIDKLGQEEAHAVSCRWDPMDCEASLETPLPSWPKTVVGFKPHTIASLAQQTLTAPSLASSVLEMMSFISPAQQFEPEVSAPPPAEPESGAIHVKTSRATPDSLHEGMISSSPT